MIKVIYEKVLAPKGLLSEESRLIHWFEQQLAFSVINLLLKVLLLLRI
jgi:hypothetical protein